MLAELRWDARVHPNEVGVIVKDGVVTLTGSVDSYAGTMLTPGRTGTSFGPRDTPPARYSS